MKKQFLLVDDNYKDWEVRINELGECIKTVPAVDSETALRIIREHPEAEWILLDGYFKKGECSDIIPYLTPEEIAKTICFSGDVEKWKKLLSKYGVRHFPGKIGIVKKTIKLCIEGTCACDC